MEFAINQAEFLTSVGQDGAFPKGARAEIAVAGKSNVGKSSLINSLCGNSRLARTSSSPGKTRLINFYRVNGDIYIVDLPGYGFARAPKGEKEKWSRLTENYLSSGRTDHIFILIDIRHAPTEDDRLMLDWIIYHNIPFTVVATKADKLPKGQRLRSASAAAELLGAPPAAIPYSSRGKYGRDELLKRLGQVANDVKMLKSSIDTKDDPLHNKLG